jgi:archaetidylinositol phosphate synthase
MLVAGMLSGLRDKLGPIIDPIADIFARAGFSPNVLTLAGLLVGLAAAYLFASGQEQLAGLAVLACGFFDLIDGAVARKTGSQTAFGGVLDSFVDRYVDLMFFIGIVIGGLAEAGGLPGWLWGVLALSGSFMVSYTRARAEAAGSEKLDIGFAERGERLLIIAIFSLLGCVRYALVVLVFLTHLTAFHRLIAARSRLARAW